MPKVIVYRYGYDKPPLMPEDEFISYKQIFSADPNYSMSPKSDFWDEFPVTKWGLILTIGGLLLVLMYDNLAFILVFGMFILFFGMMGEGESMFNYSSMLSKRQRFFDNLKKIIIESRNYYEYIENYKKLYNNA